MQLKQLVLVSTAGLAAALALSGCGKNSMATVNGEKVTKEEFYSRLERVSVPDGRGGSAQAGPLVLNQIIKEKLWEQLAKEKGVTPTEEQIKKKLDWQKKAEELALNLQRQGITVDDYKKMLRPQMAMINVVTKDEKISDADIRTAYEQNKDKAPFTRPERTRIAMIMTTSQQKAEAAYNEAQSGAKFDEVAKKMSEDKVTAANGGELGWVWSGMAVAPKQLVATAVALKPGDISKPFQMAGTGGKTEWYIVKALRRQPKLVMSYNDSKDYIREILASNKAQKDPSTGLMYAKKLGDSKISIGVEKYKGLEQMLGREQREAKKAGNKKS
jgi:parvulin-like peptidyl-prolyl isomerase